MNAEIALDIISSLVREHEYCSELKELCVDIWDRTEIAIGGRKKLVKELAEDEYDAKVINVIFAASSGHFAYEALREKSSQMDELKDHMVKLQSEKSISEIEALVHAKLAPYCPALMRVSLRYRKKT